MNTLISHILSQVKQIAQKQFGERLKAVRLYGSYARGEEREDSDIDILIVLDDITAYWKEYDKVSFQIHQAGFKHDRFISINLIEEKKYNGAETRFIRNVQKDSILL
jgi:predicted nucleotidyltransferase